MTLAILKQFELSLPDEELAALVRQALASPEMDDNQFANIVDSLGELDWLGSAFAPSLTHFIQYVDQRDVESQSPLLTHLAWAVMVFCEPDELACKPEFEPEFRESLAHLNRLFADCYQHNSSMYCLIGMAACGGHRSAARQLWNNQSESV